jgi:dephospho-CoA kinase
MQKRSMPELEALQRIQSQPSQQGKTAAANVVIQNAGSFEDTWKQVVAAWKVISPTSDTTPVVMRKSGAGELAVLRGRPCDSASIADFISHLSAGMRPLSSDDVMAAFGDKAFLLVMSGKLLVGVAGWQVENLVARTTDLYLEPGTPAAQALKALVVEIEQASKELQCEASLFFLPPQLAQQENVWKEMGYSHRTPQTLGVKAWQDAAVESQPADTIMLFRQLRHDRVLRPI